MRTGQAVDGVQINGEQTLLASVVVNCAGPHSRAINALAGVANEGNVTTKPLRQEVHHLGAVDQFTGHGGAPVTFDGDLGTYFRPDPGGLLVGGLEPACDPMEWVEHPDSTNPTASVNSYEAQTTRLARRMPELQIPPRPKGVVGIYDVSDDWIPIYDKTSLDGYYVAIGTSGNQFKNAPVIGQIMARLIDEVQHGHPHDADPVTWTAPYTGLEASLGHYSRLRQVNSESSFSVLG